MLQGLSLFLSLNLVSNSESLQHELFPVVFTSDYAYESLPTLFKNESM